MLKLALPKGRLAEESVEILVSQGLVTSLPNFQSKELMISTTDGKFQFYLVRSQDVPTYVEQGSADAGIVGWDILQESDYDLLVPVDLGIGKCRLSLASLEDFDPLQSNTKIKVATKYPNLTRAYFFSRGISCEIIKLYGSIELAALVGLSDCIVDLVSTGETLRANGLKEKDIILESTARLVVNRMAFYHKKTELETLLNSLG